MRIQRMQIIAFAENCLFIPMSTCIYAPTASIPSIIYPHIEMQIAEIFIAFINILRMRYNAINAFRFPILTRGFLSLSCLYLYIYLTLRTSSSRVCVRTKKKWQFASTYRIWMIYKFQICKINVN